MLRGRDVQHYKIKKAIIRCIQTPIKNQVPSAFNRAVEVS
jgi:hypothetical protein